MDHRASLVAVLLCLSGTASAYVFPSAPPGFGGSPGAWTFTPPSPSQQVGGIMRGPGPSIAGAAQTKAAFKLGKGAAGALARGVVRGGVAGAAIAGASWFAEHCITQGDSGWVFSCTPAGELDPVPEYEYKITSYGWNKSAATVCAQWVGGLDGNGRYHRYRRVEVGRGFAECQFDLAFDPNGPWSESAQEMEVRTEMKCPPPSVKQANGTCVMYAPPSPMTDDQVVKEMEDEALPPMLPPGIPYPVESPVWNPNEANPPAAQPLRVPQGNPQPIPDTNPQQYRQPVTRYTHSPTTDTPWRMDVTPEDVITDSPTGITEPTTVPTGTPAKETETPDLCKTNPDIVACQKLGDLEAMDVPNKNVDLAITKDDGYGPANGTCPSPKVVSVLGMQLTFPWTLFCEFALMIRPLLIGFAWLSAALTFMGIGRKD